MRRIATALVLTSLAVMVPACGSTASTLTALQCDCEHCSDITEDAIERVYEAQEEIAEAYDCLEQWDTFATCVEDQGTCREDTANFSTRKVGSCSGTQDTGVPCTSAAECELLVGGLDGQVTCSGTCQYKTCAGDGNAQTCATNDDCLGDDLCDDQQDAFSECIREASDDPSASSIDLD